jgi:glycosyltransferase involved in cell wall biosynthesis
MPEPIALLLAPRTVAGFIQYDQGQDLRRSPGVVPVDAPRIPYGVVGRLPAPLARAVAAAQARALRPPGRPAAAMIFHPFQLPLARAVLARWPGCELWYGIWDRYAEAPDAGARTRRLLERLHSDAAGRADLLFAVNTPLADAERAAGRDVELWPSAADSFPAPDPEGAIVALAMGNLGRRTDWALLRRLAEELPELVLLLVGRVAERECRGDADFAACRELSNVVWLGRRSDDEAARLILCADAGIAPFVRDEFNAAGLPNRILKAARLGRRTLTHDFPGVDVWERAVVRCRDADEWAAALRAQAGTRTRPDRELREWALAQTGERQNAPLWKRLERLGVAGPG